MKPRIAIIGGGWAGCAAGLHLAEAGVAVTLFEASATLGGRARRVVLNDLALDNGQHLLLGAYTHTLKLVNKLWREPDQALLRDTLTLEQPPDFCLRCPPLPAPFHLLGGLLGARGLTFADKLAAAHWLRHLNRHPPDDTLSVASLIASQPARVRRALWEPLCVAALNTPAAYASARIYVAVLHTVFSQSRAHSDMLFPRCDLTRLFAEPAAHRIVAQGGQVHMHTRITHLEAMKSGFSLHAGDTVYAFDRVIIAVAPQHVTRLVAALPALSEVAAALARYRYEAIATLYLQYPPEVRLARPMLGLTGGPAQFVFDRGATHAQPGMLALVASALPRTLTDADRWTQQAREQLAATLSLSAPRWQKSIIEKQATFACEPGMYRPENQTAQPGLVLAGDYTASPFPATLESATRSGVKSAQLVLDSL